MSYPPEHKQRTRARILEQAARLFRRHGYDGVGIDDIMAAADLTRGGFYAHFPSKEALFAAVAGEAPGFVRRLRAARMNPHESARDVVDGYLDPRNREEIAAGCTLATLTGDVARAGRGVRAGYTGLVRDLAEEFERHVGDGLPDRRGRALAALALCFAGVAIGRAVGDEGLATELMTACRTRALRELSGPGAKGAGASRRRAARGRRRG